MSKLIINQFIVAGLTFIIMMIFLMSIRTGFEKKGTIISVRGENVTGLSISINNRSAKNIPLEKIRSNRPGTEIDFFVPAHAYIRRIQMFQESDSGFRLKRVSFSEGQNKISVSKKDIKNFFHVQGHRFDPQTARYEKLNDTITYDKFIISSSDLSDLLKNIYIKHLNIRWILIFSMLASFCSVVIFCYALHNRKKLMIKRIIFALVVILISLPVIQMAFFSDYIDEMLLDDSITFNFFKPDDPENLVYNGNFIHGLIFWEAFADSTTHELIDTPYGPGIKVKRGDGNGVDWSLRYTGRPILYHQNHTYQIKFKYRIVKGEGIPFNIGWWVLINGKAVGFWLRLNSAPLQDGWYEANAEYTFLSNTKDPICFLNSMKDNSEILITDISIRDLSREQGQIDFVEQKIE